MFDALGSQLAARGRGVLAVNNKEQPSGIDSALHRLD
jgi:hypothetical protein